MGEDQTRTSERRNSEKKMEMDRPHFEKTQGKHYETGIDMEPSREKEQRMTKSHMEKRG